MVLFSTTDIARLRTVTQLAMPDAFVVTRTPMVDDGHGGDRLGTPFTAASGPCRLQDLPAMGAESVMAARLQLDKPAVLLMPVGTDITEKDTVTVNGSRTFQIHDVNAGGLWAVRVRVLVSEVS